MELSVCMIVKNEEAVLRKCLLQLRGIADELVIVDTGSSDRTKQIAAEFTERLYEFAWTDDFAAARSESFARARGDYLMWLDADDLLTEENQSRLRKLKKTLPARCKGVYCHYDMYENGALISSFPRLRIVRRDAGFRWRDRIHETLALPSGISPDALFRSGVRIGQQVKPRGSSGRYLEILEHIVTETDGSDLRSLYYFASELEKHGRDAESAARFESFFDHGGRNDPNCVFACMQLGALYERTAEYEKALALYSACMPHCGRRAEYCCSVGNFYLESGGDPDEAAFWYEAALACPKPDGDAVLERFYYYLPHFRLYQIYDAAGDRQKADAHLLQAAEQMKKLERAGHA